MNKSKVCSICKNKISFKKYLQNYPCTNCISSNDKLLCNSCLSKIDVCPFCRGSKSDEVRIDIHRTTLGAVSNVIVTRKKKCYEKVIEKIFNSDNIILDVKEDETEINYYNCLSMLNIKGTLISIWIIVVLFSFGYFGCNKSNNECSICIIGGILTPICIISYILKLLSEMESKQNLIFSCFWSFLFTILILMIFGVDFYCNFNSKILYIGFVLYILFFCCSFNSSIKCCF